MQNAERRAVFSLLSLSVENRETSRKMFLVDVECGYTA